MNHKTTPVTSNDVYVLQILLESEKPLTSKELSELREDSDDPELDNAQYFLNKLQKAGFIKKLRSNGNFIYELTPAGLKIVSDVKTGFLVPIGTQRTPLSSYGTCEQCRKENCNRTRYKINGEMKKVCRECLIDDTPMSPEEFLDGRYHSSIAEFDRFPVWFRKPPTKRRKTHESSTNL